MHWSRTILVELHILYSKSTFCARKTVWWARESCEVYSQRTLVFCVSEKQQAGDRAKCELSCQIYMQTQLFVPI